MRCAGDVGMMEKSGMMPQVKLKFQLIAAGVSLFAIATWASAQAPSPQVPATTYPAATTSNPANTPNEVADRLVADARASFARVKDYVGLFSRQERINGQL